jgi:hypothetical protein
MNDDFFIGYLPHMPTSTRRLVKRALVLLLACVVVVASVLVFAQSRLAPAFFEFTKTTEFIGTIAEYPYPMLRDAQPPSNGQPTYLLVAPGKFGAGAIVVGFDGARVRVKGKKIYRDGLAMIEIMPGTIQRSGDTAKPDSAPVLSDELTLTGEIVDSKCYYGVMNPGEGKVHRDCAARCLSGGVPPSFVVRGGPANGAVYLLTDNAGAPLRPASFLDRVGQPVTIRGREARNAATAELRVISVQREP